MPKSLFVFFILKAFYSPPFTGGVGGWVSLREGLGVDHLKIRVSLLPHRLCAIGTAVAALRQCLQLTLDELFAERRQMVDEHLGIQMIELVLHDTCQIAIDPFVVLLEVLIHVLHMNASVARHILVDAGQR